MKTRGSKRNYEDVDEGIVSGANQKIDDLLTEPQKQVLKDMKQEQMSLDSSESSIHKPSTSKCHPKAATKKSKTDTELMSSYSSVSSMNKPTPSKCQLKVPTNISKRGTKQISSSDSSDSSIYKPSTSKFHQKTATNKSKTISSDSSDSSVIRPSTSKCHLKRATKLSKAETKSASQLFTSSDSSEYSTSKEHGNSRTLIPSDSSDCDNSHLKPIQVSSDSSDGRITIRTKPKPQETKVQNDSCSSIERVSKSDYDSDSDAEQIALLQDTLQKLIEKKRVKNQKLKKMSVKKSRKIKEIEKKLESKKSSDDSDKDFLATLNNHVYTSRDLKINTAYKLLSIQITEESGFNNTTYKKATGTFQDVKNPRRTLTVVLPKPVAMLPSETIDALKKRIKKGRNPTYTVNNITKKQRPGGNGSFDVVDFAWK